MNASISRPFAANVLDYGADPTGTYDSTAAIQKACDENKHIYFPEGTYLIDRLTVSSSSTLCGAGDACTIIKTTNLTDNIITFSAHGWHVRDMKFDAVSPRTSGAYIYASWKYKRAFTDSTKENAANFASIENVAVTHQYIGIELDGCWSVNISNITAFDGTPHEVSPGGAIIALGRTTYTGPIHIRGLTGRTCSPDWQPTCGIFMGHVDVVCLADILLIYHRKDVWISPKANQFAALIEVTNCCFDTAKHGIYIEPKEGARVLRCGFANTWFGAHTSDSAVIDATEGVVTGLQFTNCMFIANAGNGVTITGQGVDGLFFSNSFSSGNLGHGLAISDNARNVIWNGGVIGKSHEMNGNVQYGYTAEKGCTGTISLTNLQGNSGGVCSDPDQCISTFANTLP